MKKILLLALLFGCKDSKPIDIEPENKAHPLTITVFPDTTYGIDYGKGVNTSLELNGLDKATCVVPGEAKTIGGQSGGKTTIRVENLTSQNEFFEKINKDVNIVINMVEKKGAAATKNWLTSASFNNNQSSLHEYKFKRNANYAMIVAEKRFLAKNITPTKVDPAIMRFSDKQFWDRCGDGFLSSTESGAKVVGLLECIATSNDTKDQVKRVMEGKAGLYGVEGSRKFTQIVETLEKSNIARCQIFVQKEGGVGSVSLQSDKFAQSLVDYIENATLQSARPVGVGISPYSIVTDLEFLDYWTSIERSIAHKQSKLSMRKRALQTLFTRWNAIEEMNRLNEGRNWPDRDKYRQQQSELSNKIVSESQKYLRCAKDPFNGC